MKTINFPVKKSVLLLIVLTMSRGLYAQLDIPPVGFNPRATVTEEVGITNITIKYGRPGVKGREGNIWGKLVNYGFGSFNFISNNMSSPWRAGANEATTISFEHDVKVEGEWIKAGTYALFMAIGKDSIMLIFSKQTGAWGSFYYKQADDVLRVSVKPALLQDPVEWLKYEFIAHTEKSCTIAMQWEKLSVPFTIDVDVENIVLAGIRSEMTGPKSFITANLIQASSYCFEKNINEEEALAWAQRAVTGKPFGQTAYHAYANLAEGYIRLNRLQQADSVMNEALLIANSNEYIGYGRELLAQKRNDRALQVMRGAQKKFGDLYIVNNGLSYAYSANGDYNKALEFAQKALLQASPQSKPVIAGNIEKLKKGININ